MTAMVPDDPPGTADSNLNEGEALINSHTTDINNNKSTTTTAAIRKFTTPLLQILTSPSADSDPYFWKFLPQTEQKIVF